MKESKSSTEKGRKLENQVYDLISDLLNQDNFIVPNKLSRIFKQKGYYSTKREKEIIFDITIETTLPDAEKYSMLTIFECKNLNSKVSVDDVEEFGSKLNQIGEHNTKGIIITTSSFQESAFKLAKNEGIGLIRINSQDKIQWVNYRKDSSASKRELTNKNELIEESITTNPFIASYKNNSFSNIADLLIELSVIDKFTDSVEFIKIPYVSHERLNVIVNKLYEYSLYDDVQLNIEKLTTFLEDKYKVVFEYDVTEKDEYLGKIEFNPLCIKISRKAREDNNRWRFTIAHEIGHLILHTELLKDRFDEQSDDECSLKYSYSKKNTEKLELQANLFASYLLLRESLLINETQKLFKEYRINRGRLYLDNQPVNKSEVYAILGQLSLKFQVSIEAIKIRLMKLNLLEDKTNNSIRNIINEYYK